MPPIPPPPPAVFVSSSLISATKASVVSIRLAIEAAFCRASRVTLAGSMTPALIMSPNSPLSASKPKSSSFDSRTRPTITAPSAPALSAICRMGSSRARFTMLTPMASSSWSLSFSSAPMQRTSATPPPGTMPSSTAARVACVASSTRSFFSFTSTSSRRRRGSPRHRPRASRGAPAIFRGHNPRSSPRSAERRAESRPGRIGPISLDAKQMGERSAGNPHAAFDVEGAGNVARSKLFGLNRRASPRPYLEAPALVSGLDNFAVMGQPVEQRGRHLGVAEHAWPFAEGQVGGDDDGSALVEPADQMKEQLSTGLGEWEIAELIEHDKVETGQVIGEPPLPAGAGFALQSVDEVDDGVKAASGAAANAGPRDGYGQMRLAGAGAADQDSVALLGKKGAIGQLVDERLVDRRAGEVEVVNVLGQRQLGYGQLIFDRARLLVSDLGAEQIADDPRCLVPALDAGGHHLVVGRPHTVELERRH